MKKRSIDISSQVMSSIKDKDIRMRPRNYFVAKRVLKTVLLILATVVFVGCVSAIVYSIRSVEFGEYLKYGRFGLIRALRSLPWLAFVITGSLSIALITSIRKLLHKIVFSLAPGFAALILLFGIGATLTFIPGLDTSARNTAILLQGGKKSVMLTGEVERLEDDGLVLRLSDDGNQSVTFNKDVLFVNGQPEKGDKIMVLGSQKGSGVSADVIKSVSKAPEKIEKIVPESPKAAPVEAPTPQPAPAKVVKETPPSAPKPTTPAPVSKSITITSVSGPFTSDPYTKYQVNWSANFTSASGYKLVWSTSPEPTYPGSPYYYYSTPNSSSGSGNIKNYTGSGKFYVRVCEYLGGSCGAYSNQITLDF